MRPFPHPFVAATFAALAALGPGVASADPDAPSRTAESARTSAPRTRESSFTVTVLPEFGIGALATTVTMPATLTLARAIGTSSPSIYASGIPALLFAVFVPPAIATAATTWARNRLHPKSASFFPTYWYATTAQVAVVAGALGAKVWVGDARDLLLLSAVEGVVLPAAATLGNEIHARHVDADDAATHGRSFEMPRIQGQTVSVVRGTF